MSQHPKRPGRTAVYRLYDAQSRLLYVGIGELPGRRWQDHRTHKVWWPDVVRAEVVWRATRDEAEVEEARAIRTEHPMHNVAGTAKRRKPRTGIALPPVVAGFAEVHAALGLSRGYVQTLTMRPDFPEPYDSLRAGRVWRSEDVESWIREHRPNG